MTTRHPSTHWSHRFLVLVAYLASAMSLTATGALAAPAICSAAKRNALESYVSVWETKLVWADRLKNEALPAGPGNPMIKKLTNANYAEVLNKIVHETEYRRENADSPPGGPGQAGGGYIDGREALKRYIHSVKRDFCGIDLTLDFWTSGAQAANQVYCDGDQIVAPWTMTMIDRRT
ncbi:MAG: hypothetical protein KDA28_08935, partial [Phycisphaerales bacterium]|nr:hypothetical protein [Phycisphaerales bacterium]